MSAWPFSSPETKSAITVKQIISKQAPILLVRHDGEGGEWHFLPGGKFSIDDSTLVSLKEIVAIDPSVKEIADLPEDWEASRDHVGGPWERKHI